MNADRFNQISRDVEKALQAEGDLVLAHLAKPIASLRPSVAKELVEEIVRLRTALKRIVDYKKGSEAEDDHDTVLMLQAIADDAVCPKVIEAGGL